MNCVIFNCNKYQTSNVSSFGCVTILFLITFLLNKLEGKRGVAVGGVQTCSFILGVLVLCNKFQGDLHCKES